MYLRLKKKETSACSVTLVCRRVFTWNPRIIAGLVHIISRCSGSSIFTFGVCTQPVTFVFVSCAVFRWEGCFFETWMICLHWSSGEIQNHCHGHFFHQSLSQRCNASSNTPSHAEKDIHMKWATNYADWFENLSSWHMFKETPKIPRVAVAFCILCVTRNIGLHEHAKRNRPTTSCLTAKPFGQCVASLFWDEVLVSKIVVPKYSHCT